MLQKIRYSNASGRQYDRFYKNKIVDFLQKIFDFSVYNVVKRCVSVAFVGIL